FFIVADGMGGHSRGEVASKLASKSYIDFIENANLDDYSSYVDLQEEAIKYANSEIYKLSDDSEGLRMGTTVVCMLVDRKNAIYYISHVGDSRIYIYQDKKLRVRTRDHSLINDLIDTGSLTEDEAENFINKSAIT
ncbi:protein phosphatase 2C domain-containing protein, partial [Klebsiella pneumoniae]|uniref:protein phosphatase 2C domain-containing protein n=2 Tax=Bacteria TaxID=2 RepID=UPI003A878580